LPMQEIYNKAEQSIKKLEEEIKWCLNIDC
jgi:hypothetical protein